MLLLFAPTSEWFNYPGLEAWKFVNLAIFIGFAIYVLRRKVKISELLGARRDAIKRELVQAQEEKARALAKVAEADSLLSRLDADVHMVHEQARAEAESERQRVAAATEHEMEKLREQAQREIETADKVARKELRRFFARRSIDVARETVRSQMRPEDDSNLIGESLVELRRTRV